MGLRRLRHGFILENLPADSMLTRWRVTLPRSLDGVQHEFNNIRTFHRARFCERTL